MKTQIDGIDFADQRDLLVGKKSVQEEALEIARRERNGMVLSMSLGVVGAGIILGIIWFALGLHWPR